MSVLISRLLADTSAQRYGYDLKRGSPPANGADVHFTYGISLDELKAEAKALGLLRSSDRFILVLHILEAKNKCDSEIAHSKGGKNLPDPRKLAAQIRKICFPPEKEYRNWKDKMVKSHTERAVKAINAILCRHVLDKELCEKGHSDLAWEICELTITPLIDAHLPAFNRAKFEITELFDTLKRLAASGAP